VGSRLSPLGALELAYVIAAGGQTVQPRIVERAGPYRAPSRRRVLRRVMTTWTARHLRRMMEVTVHSGTSLDVFSDQKGRSYLRGIRVAGKTGTLKRSANAPTTTWFVGFAPSTKPRVVVSVLVENGEVWRRKANEVARDVLRAYFADRGAAGVTHPLEND
jgi:cell division protein FtsI/penicillin-binding protein 2